MKKGLLEGNLLRPPPNQFIFLFNLKGLDLKMTCSQFFSKRLVRGFIYNSDD